MSNEIRVVFPGGARVDAMIDGFVVRTDQPPASGGEGTAPSPFDLFLASLATCAGFYAMSYCRARGLPTEGMTLAQRYETDVATKLPRVVQIEIALPPGFPEQHRAPMLRAIASCKVKKTIAAGLDVRVSYAEKKAA
jgi:putative redox protein